MRQTGNMLSIKQSADERDLEWFFCDAESASGMRSSFPAMVYAIQCGPRSGLTDFDPGPKVLAAASRARPISRALTMLPAHQSGLLGRTYGVTQYPKLVPSLGRLAAAVLDTQHILEAASVAGCLDGRCAGWLADLILRDHTNPVILRAKIAAQQEVQSALKAYSLHRKRGARV